MQPGRATATSPPSKNTTMTTMTTKTMSKNRYKPTYWNEEGEMQEIYDALNDALVADVGDAPTKHGNALRWIGNIYHEVYNNGGCNAARREYGERYLADWYENGVALVVEVASLSETERKTLRNALLYGNAMCDGNRPLAAKRLDEIVTKVINAVLLAHLASLPRPQSK